MTEGGLSAINFEHAWGDGVAILRFFNEVFKETTQSPYIPSGNPSPSNAGVERVELQLSDRLKSAIETARREVEEKAKTLSVNTMQYGRYGKDFIKAQNLSPDAVMQLAIQVSTALSLTA